MKKQTKLNRVLFGRIQKTVWVGLFFVFVALFSVFTEAPRTSAAINNTMNFQARLLQNSGAVVPDGYYNAQFKIYSVSSGGSALWTETYYDSNGAAAGNDNRVRVVNGYLTVNLNSINNDWTAGGTGITNWDQDMWLGMNIGDTTQIATPTWDGEMSPRMKLTAVPYAFQAKSATQVQASNSGFTGTLGFTTLSADRSILLPDEGGTVCLQNSANCGFLTGSTADFAQKSQANTFANTNTFNVQSATALTIQSGSTGPVLFQADTTNMKLNLATGSAGEINAFSTGTSLPQPRDSYATTTANGYIYVIGGENSADSTSVMKKTVYYAKLNPDGSVGAWKCQGQNITSGANDYCGTTPTNSNTLATQMASTQAVVYNGFIYLIGGTTDNATPSSVVQYAKLNTDGSTGSWSTTTSLNTPRFGISAAALNGYIVAVGGWAGAAQTNTQMAKIRADGSLGTWSDNNSDSNIYGGAGIKDAAVAVANNYMYIAGGHAGSSTYRDKVYASHINADGTRSAWTQVGNLSSSTAFAAQVLSAGVSGMASANAYVANGYFYFMGGYMGSNNASSATYYAKINGDGTLSNFTNSTRTLPGGATRTWAGFSGVTSNGYMYVIGGAPSGGGTSQSTVYYTTGPRVVVGGTLDLVGSSGISSGDAANGGSGGVGGELRAGNTDVVGTLDVRGPTSLHSSLMVDGEAYFRSAANSTTAFQIQNSIGSNVISIDTTSLNSNIVNSSFESATITGWASKQNATVSQDTANSYIGNSSLKAVLGNTPAINDGIKYTLPSSLSAGTYTLSFDIKQAPGPAFGTSLQVGSNNGVDNACTLSPTLTTQPIPTTGWARYSCTFTTSGTTTFIYWKQTDAPASGRTFNIDAVQLEVGTVASAYKETGITLNGLIGTPLAIKAANDSTTAFQVQNAAGTSIFTIDTLNNQIVFGGSTVFAGPNSYGPTTVTGSTTPSFATYTNLTTASASTSAISADVNKDGKPDVVAVNSASNSVSVMLNTGNATFAAKVDYSTGTGPQAVAYGDFNADNKTDLAVTNYSAGTGTTVTVLLGDGTGVFSGAAGSPLTAGTGVYGIAVADLNKDGKSDIVATNYGTANGTTVSVFISTGGGTFANQVTYTVGTAPRGVIATDLTGDGYPEIVTANYNGNNVSVLTNLGSGAFNTTAVNTTVGNNPSGLAYGDINGDDKYDVVVANMGSDNISVLNNVSGALPSATNYSIGASTAPYGVAIGDINGDIKADIVTASNGTNKVTALANSGTGTFPSAVAFGTGASTRSVAIGDFNGDNKLDVVTANNGTSTTSVSILLNNIGYAFTVNGSSNFTNNIYAQGQSVFKNSFDSTTAFQVQDAAGTSIFNVDTFNKTISFAGSASFTGSNNFGQTTITGSNVPSFASKADYTTATAPQAIAVADWSGDGKADIVAANSNSTITVLKNTGSGAYTTQTSFSAGNDVRSIGITDINGDGCADILIANYGGGAGSTVQIYTQDAFVFLGVTCQNTFSFDRAINTGVGPRSMVFADVNGDGKTDIITANYGSTSGSGNTVSVLTNNGSGTSFGLANVTVGSGPISVATADKDGDGVADFIFAANYGNAGSGNTVSVLGNNGSGTFTLNTTVTVGSGPMSVVAGDINNDGTTYDFATANYGNASGSGSTVSTVFGTAPFSFPQWGSAISVTTGSGPSSIAIADLNGDLASELITANYGNAGSGNTISVLTNSGTGTFTAAPLNFTTASGPISLSAVDINGDVDTKPDIVTANYNNNTGNTVSVLLNNVGYAFQVSGISNFSGGIYSSGAVKLKNATNSTIAFQIQNAVGANLFNADTKNMKVTLGGTLVTTITQASNATSVATTTTTNTSTGSALVANNTSTGKSIDVQSSGKSVFQVTNNAGAEGSAVFSSKTNNTSAFQVQNSAGSSIFNVDNVNSKVTLSSAVDFAAKVDYFTGPTTTNGGGQAYGDFNGDGYPDIVTTNDASSNISVLLNNGNGTYATKVNYSIGVTTNPRQLAVADFNGDNKQDIAFVSTQGGGGKFGIYLGTGTGTFGAVTLYNTGGGFSAFMAVGDFNNDTKPDIVTVEALGATATVFLNSGTGTFGAGTTYAVSGSQGVTVGDINNDNNIDLVVLSGNNLSVRLGTGTGTFGSANTYATGSGPTDVSLADVNGDNKLDAITVNNSAGTVSVLIGSGTGAFATKVDYTTGTISRTVGIGDMNGDGKKDLAVSSQSSVAILTNNGDGTFAAKADFSINSSAMHYATLVVDVNGDTKPDVVTATSDAVSVMIAVTRGNVLQVDGGALYQGIVTIKGASNSTTSLLIQNSSGATLFTADTQNSRIIVGTTTNGVILSANGIQLNGTARNAETITLTPEYAGAVLDGSGTGTMTAAYDSTAKKNYYKWTTTQVTSQGYDIVITTAVPSDWGTWAASNPLTLDTWTDNTSNSTGTITVTDTSGATDTGINGSSITPGSTSTWTTNNKTFSGTYTANGIMVIRIHMTANNGSNFQVGPLKLNYLSKF
jgi:hypothetical protein